MNAMLFDLGLPGETTALIAGVGLLFILAAAAYVMFRILRKTMKMAFRMAMVVTVLFTLVVGAFAVYWYGVGTSSKPTRPERSRPHR